MTADDVGRTWWSRDWLEALDERAHDHDRVARGRTYARQGRVSRLEVVPGKLTALVRGDAALPYRVTVTVPVLARRDWTTFAASVAARAANTAALLDGELDPELIDEAARAGVSPLPVGAELGFGCSCPDHGDPCKHAAAVCYQFAEALDHDPFALFALRGRDRTELMELIRSARNADGTGADVDASAVAGTGPGGSGRMVSAAFGGGAVVDPGMVAREAWSRTVPQRPPRRELPPEPGAPMPWPAEPPREAPFSAAGLTELAADAAARAWAQLADGEGSQLDLDAAEDLARRASRHLGELESLLELARRADLSAPQLTHQAVAWRNAGRAGLGAIDESLWRPPTDVIDRGLDAFDAAGVDPDDVQVRSNRLTSGDVQLRVTSDGQWWRYEKRGRSWELVEPPADTPDDLVSG